MEQKNGFILITGCSGRIGFRCAERLSKKYQIIGVDVYLVGYLEGVALVGMDLSSEKNLEKGLELIHSHFGNRVISVIHLAAYYSFTKGHWDLYEKITINGTRNLLKKLKEKFEVEQFIFSSTMLVHAPCERNQKITEDSLVQPTWNYPKSKVATEKALHEIHGDTPILIIRIAGVYDDLCHSIPLSNQIQRIFENQFEGHVFAGNIHHGASFIHMEDLVEAICSAIEKRKELPSELVLLIGEPVTLSYDALQRQISRLLYGKEWKTWSIPKPIAKIGALIQQFLPFFKKGFIQPWMISIADDNYVLDISKAEKFLNWRPKQTLEQTIPKWTAMLKKDPSSWYNINKLKPSAKVLKKKKWK